MPTPVVVLCQMHSAAEATMRGLISETAAALLLLSGMPVVSSQSPGSGLTRQPTSDKQMAKRPVSIVSVSVTQRLDASRPAERSDAAAADGRPKPKPRERVGAFVAMRCGRGRLR